MRYWKSILTIALMGTLGFYGFSLAQPPGGPRGGRNGPGVSTDDLIQRILRYDKDKDGKVSKNELPDRMQHLLDMGDTNKDGFLDKDEIKALAERLNKDTPRGPGGPGGQPGPGGPGFGPPPGGPDGLARILEDLNLPEKTMDKADAIVRAHQRKMRRLMDQAREDLLKEMKPILSAEEFEKFKEALDRRPPPPPPPPPGE
jgi:hypothetical protein